jgi:hypothetical protein
VSPLRAAPRAPYALEPTPFRFPHLAAMAGRAGMGGPREVAVACLVVAHLVRESCCVDSVLTPDQRRARALGAKQWLAAAAVSGGIRAALVKAAEASAAEPPGTVSEALESVIAVTANQLDPSARLELSRLAQMIAA